MAWDVNRMRILERIATSSGEAELGGSNFYIIRCKPGMADNVDFRRLKMNLSLLKWLLSGGYIESLYKGRKTLELDD